MNGDSPFSFSDLQLQSSASSSNLEATLGMISTEKDAMKKDKTFAELLDQVMKNAGAQGVHKIATYMKEHPTETFLIQMQLKQRVYRKSSESKINVLYILHEFFKIARESEKQKQQSTSNSSKGGGLFRQWIKIIDEIIHGIIRVSSKDVHNRITKILARWNELELFQKVIPEWTKVASGIVKCKKTLVRLPVSASPDKLPYKVIDMEHKYQFIQPVAHYISTKEIEIMKSHWRYTSCFFLRYLAESLGLDSVILSTACMYFHVIFDKGIYHYERYRVASACMFLAAKTENERIKMFKIVRAVYGILLRHLIAGDEDVDEIEKVHMLHYEMDILHGLDYDLAVDLGFDYLELLLKHVSTNGKTCLLKRVAETKTSCSTSNLDAAKLSAPAQKILIDLYCLPLCREVAPEILASGAFFIASNEESCLTMGFSQLRDYLPSKRHRHSFTPDMAEYIADEYQDIVDWQIAQSRDYRESPGTSLNVDDVLPIHIGRDLSSIPAHFTGRTDAEEESCPEKDRHSRRRSSSSRRDDYARSRSPSRTRRRVNDRRRSSRSPGEKHRVRHVSKSRRDRHSRRKSPETDYRRPSCSPTRRGESHRKRRRSRSRDHRHDARRSRYSDHRRR